jgi:hypothetical protein
MKKTFASLSLVAAMGVLPLAFLGCATDSDRDDSHKRTAGEFIDDKVLVQKVKSALDDSEVYKFPDVKVNTYQRTVQLSGFVETAEQKAKAAEIARSVRGVQDVENSILLKSERERVRTTDRDTNTLNRTTAPVDR